MAFYKPEDDQEDEIIGGGVQTSPAAATISGQGAQATSAKTNSPDKSGNFVGIHQYLGANKNQASKLGDQAATVINTSADEARQKVGELKSAADQSIAPVAQLSDDLSSKLSSTAEALTGDERKLIKETASAQYKGPKTELDFGDKYTGAQRATQTAQQNIDKSGTEEGRMGLISQINSKPRTQGMNVFDNALLQAGSGREKLAQASQANQGVGEQFNQTTQDIRNKIGRVDDPNTPDVNEATGAMGLTPIAQADAYKKIQDAMNSWKSGFNPRVESARNDLVGLNTRLSQDLGETPYELDSETMSMFGLQPDANVYDLNLQDYLKSANPDEVSAANIATQDDYAKYAALSDLAGESGLLRPEDVSLAGTAPKTTIDTAKLATDRQAKEQYTQRLNQDADSRQSELASFAAQLGGLGSELLEMNLLAFPQHRNTFNQLQAAAEGAAAARDKWLRESKKIKSSGK